MTSRPVLLLALMLVIAGGCGRTDRSDGRAVVTFSGSVVGAESEILREQLQDFTERNPDVVVDIQSTPDAADQRHQLYVQWLNARTSDPDILQLDVIWTAEFAAAGWILPLDPFGPEPEAFFDATIQANRWRGPLYAIPWFVDVGLLYWRTDLLDAPPATWAELQGAARRAVEEEGARYGFVWQGARYEGLVTVFLELLHASGGRILGGDDEVYLDREEAVAALTFLRDAVAGAGISPEAVLSWQEEQVRFAFQNGEALFMRNWPYAAPLLDDSEVSRVAGRFAVAPLPAGPGGIRASALGGQQLAINAHSDEPEAAWRVVQFLTSPERMMERALATGQYPTRPALYDVPELAAALPVSATQAREAIENAVPRPVTPLYTELSGTLQIWLHRALTGQAQPREALEAAGREIRILMERAPPPPGETR